MAFILKNLTKGNEDIVDQTLSTKPAKESLGGTVLRNTVGGLSKAASTPYDILTAPSRISDSLEEYHSNANKEMYEKALQSGTLNSFQKANVQKSLKALEKKENPIISQVTKSTDKVIDNVINKVLPKDYLKPKNDFESNIQDVIGHVAFGTSAGASQGLFKNAKTASQFAYDILKRSVQGKVGKYTAKALGADDVGQMIAEIGTPVALEALNVNNLLKGLRPVKNELYESAEKASGFKKIDADKMGSDIEKILDSNFLKKPGGKEVQHNLGKIYDSINRKDNKIHVSDIFKAKKELNSLAYDSKVSDTAKKTYKRVLAMTNGLLDKAGEEFKDFGNAYKSANNLTRISNEAKQTSDFIKQTFEKSTLSSNPIRFLFKVPEKSTRQALNAVGTAGELFIDHPKQFMDYYGKALVAASEKQVPAFLNNVKKMNKLISEKKPEEKKGFSLRAIK